MTEKSDLARALDALADEFERDMSVAPDAESLVRLLASIPHATRVAELAAWRDANVTTRMIATSVVYAAVSAHASREDLVDPMAGLETLARQHAMLAPAWIAVTDGLEKLRALDADEVTRALDAAATWAAEQDARTFGPDGLPRGRKSSGTGKSGDGPGPGGGRVARDYSAVPEGTRLVNPAGDAGYATYVDGVLMVDPLNEFGEGMGIRSLSAWAREGHAANGNMGASKSASGTRDIKVKATNKAIVEACPPIAQ